MNLSAQIAKHFREVHFGGNWTSVNLKETLNGISWQHAVTTIYGLNSIAILVYHTNYYVSMVLKVFDGQALDGHDTLSFNLPPIASEDDWKKMVDKTFTDAEKFASLVEQIPEDKLGETFVEEKYGNYYRNIHGIIEHTHYHVGQIMLIKKMLLQETA